MTRDADAHADTLPLIGRWRRSGLALSLALSAFGLCPVAQAQYKVVGPDGRVTYTDQVPAGVKAQTIQGGASGGEVSSRQVDQSQWPFELRETAKRFPVTLITGDNCAPCDLGRSALQHRGIPYTERSVKTREDFSALRSQEGGGDLPVLHVGGQRLKGFDSVEWTSYLDAAGYPKTSALPSRYSAPPVQALAGLASVRPVKKEVIEPPRARVADPAPAAVSASGTTLPGFRF